MRGLNFDDTRVGNNPQTNAADAIAESRSSGRPVGSKADLMNQFMKDKMGVSKQDFEQAMNAVVTPDEVDAQLTAEGIDPATATDSQRASATMRVKLGKELGLTPAEVEQVMAAQAMAPQQLQELLTTTSELTLTDGKSIMAATRGTDSLRGTRSKTDASQMTVELGPPTPQMSITSFIAALVKAIESVLRVKSSTQISDAKIMESKLKDIVVMTQEKIEQATKANDEMVSSLRRAIDNMKTMRIVMYTVLALVVLIMIIVTVVTGILTGGASVAPLVIATIGLVMAVAGAMTTIILTEQKRKGQLKLSAEGADALVGAMAAAEIVAGIASFGIGAAASVIKAMIVQLVAQIIAAVSRMVSLIATSGALEAWAKRKAQQKFQHSNEKQKIEDSANTQKAEIDRKQASGEITVDDANTLRSAVDQTKNASLMSAEKKMISDETKSAQKIMEIVNWVVVAVSIVFAIFSVAAATGALGNSIKEAISKLAEEGSKKLSENLKAILQALSLVLQVVQVVVTIGQSIYQGISTVQTETDRQVHLEKTLNLKQMIIRLDALKTMFEDIKSNLDSSSKQAADSMRKLASALSEAFETNARVMSDFTG